MAEIKIFLASSFELKEDRNQFEILIRRKNDEWIAEGKPYLDLQIWEEASDAMSATRSQDEYNKIIQEVDIFVMLFWTKVGKYTHEEFRLAKKLFLETGKPRVLVYQKMANPENQEQSLKDFINGLLTQDKEYFWGNYEHFDTLALKFDKELRLFYKNQHRQEFQTKIAESAKKIDLTNEVNAILDAVKQQRIQDIGKRLTQLQTLLAKYQETLDFEENPKLQMKYEKEIANTEKMIEKVLAEINQL
jgi:hypothetical protein